VLIPGVISHATNIVEHPELVAERIVRLARLVGRENLIAGTDCGFAQGPFSPPRPSLDHVGQARSTGGRRTAGEPGAVGLSELERVPSGEALRLARHAFSRQMLYRELETIPLAETFE
jgi:hypothetical protein